MREGLNSNIRYGVDAEGNRAILIGSVAEMRGVLAELGIDVHRPSVIPEDTEIAKPTLDPKYLRPDDGSIYE